MSLIMVNLHSSQEFQELIDKNQYFLFDLDGTLLPIDMDSFLNKYFASLRYHFSEEVEGDRFITALMQATEAMIKNDGELNNQSVFKEEFFRILPELDKAETLNAFDEFYKKKFPYLGDNINKNPEAVKVLDLLKKKNKKLVLATNPVFPVEAVESRLKWIGLSKDYFEFITCYSNMHYCKPNPGYYKEIIDKIGIRPENAVMVGNDQLEDMIAGELGLDTILITDNLKESDQGYEPDWQGSRTEFYQKVRNWSRM